MKKIILLFISILSLLSSNSKTCNMINHIEINKINLNQEIKSYKESTVDSDIIYLKETSIKDNFYILAAHSGNSSIAYFKNLYKLQKGDRVVLYINNRRIRFEVSSVYFEKKNGKIHLNKNMKDTLILTTCDRFNKNRQLIVECKKNKTS